MYRIGIRLQSRSRWQMAVCRFMHSCKVNLLVQTTLCRQQFALYFDVDHVSIAHMFYAGAVSEMHSFKAIHLHGRHPGLARRPHEDGCWAWLSFSSLSAGSQRDYNEAHRKPMWMLGNYRKFSKVSEVVRSTSFSFAGWHNPPADCNSIANNRVLISPF